MKLRSTPQKTIDLIGKNVKTPEPKKSNRPYNLSASLSTSVQFGHNDHVVDQIHTERYHEARNMNRQDSNSSFHTNRTNEEILDMLGKAGVKGSTGPFDKNFDKSMLDLEKSLMNYVDNHKLDNSKLSVNETTRRPSDLIEMSQHKMDLSVLCQHYDSYIYVLGGFIDGNQLHIERFDVSRSKWELAGKLNFNRTKFSSIVLPNGNILLMGGKQVILLFEKY